MTLGFLYVIELSSPRDLYIRTLVRLVQSKREKSFLDLERDHIYIGLQVTEQEVVSK